MKKILFSSIAGVCFLFGINTTFAADSLPKKMEEVACSTMQSFFTDGGVSLQPNDQCFVMSGNQKIYTGYKIGNLGDYYINQSQTDEHYVFESTPTGVQGLQIKRTPLQGEWKIDNNGDIFRWATTQETGVERKVANINGQSVYFRVYPANTTHLMVRSEDTQGIHLTNVTPNMNPNLPAYRITYVTNSYVIRDGKFQGPTTHQEHAFYYAAWCGDGVVDTVYGEVYDDGVNNGKPGYASTDCKTKTDTPKPGVCDGASAGVATYTAPTTNLCKTGTPSVVRDVGTKFTWTCNGVDGGTNTACEAPKKQSISGTCDGASNGIPTINPPTTNLCKTGTASTPVLDNTGTKYEWTCNGEGTGGNATCEAPKKSDDPKSYCGDGVVQTGESCDLGSNNGKPVNGVIACDATCNTPETPKVCDQTFSGSLYVGQAVTFYDAYTNHNTFPHTLNSFQVDFIESDDMNKDGKSTFAEYFQWVSPYKNGSQIPAGAKDVKVISTNMAYRVLQAPKVRKSDNISINYSINISTPNGTSSHKECINYEVAWCGDGVIDTKYGETCDPADPTKKNWGPNGCNTAGTISNDGKNISCQPKEGTPLDLSIKKYIDQDDAQPGNAVEKNTNDTFNYVIKVKVESGKTTGTTTVRDILPTGIDLTSSAAGEGWTCAFNPTSRLLECTSTAVVDAGKYFADITVPVKILSAKGEVRNDATVHNPNENPNSCYTDNRMPSGSEQSCQKDSKNTDPAVVKVSAKNDLSIKKYAGDKDGQVLSDALSVDYGKEFTYKYVITASGSTDQKNVTVTDKFPLGVKVTGFDKIPANWTCKNGQVTDSGKVHHTAICNTPTFAKNTSVEIIVKVQLVSETEFKNLNLPLGVFTKGLRNIAYVCSEEVTSTNPITGTTQTKVCDSECTDPNDPKCLPPPPPPECSPIPGDPHYDPACVKIQKLEIKKYVQGKDAQTAADQVSVKSGEEFEYTFEVKNTTPVDATGAKVEDIFPSTIQVVKTGVGTDWTCTQNGQTMTCFYNKTIKAGEVAPIIKAIVKTNTTAKQGVSIRNVAAVCEFDSTKPTNDENCTPNPNECKPGDVNYNPTTKVCDPATVVIDESTDGLDLSIKKYIDQYDAQTAISKNTNDTFNYVLKVKVESGKATGTTTVKDILPHGVELNGTTTGTNWTISFDGKTMTATSTQEVTAENFFPEIKIPVRITVGKNATIRNDATVHNPNENPNSCYTDNRMPSGSERSCQKDSKNTDPAIFKTPDDRDPPPPPPRGYCGDGIVDKGAGEVCDLGFYNNGRLRGDSGQVICSSDCNNTIITNPAEHKEFFYITIPSFTKVSLGKKTGTILAEEYGMVVGTNTKLFALSDIVDFQYKNITDGVNIAKTLDSRMKFRISGDGSVVAGESPMKPIADFNNLPRFTTPGNGTFYVLGEAGSRFVIPEEASLSIKNFSISDCIGLTANGKVEAYECKVPAGFKDSITLFNGSQLQNIISKETPSKDGKVYFGTENVKDVAQFEVEVTSAKISAAGSSVSRGVQAFSNIDITMKKLRETLMGNTVNNTDTQSNDAFPFGSTTTSSVTPMNSGITNTYSANISIEKLSDLDKHKHNGNSNVYSVRFTGTNNNLTIKKDLKLSGVKTILVENGNIVFEADTSYQNTDASWAFIAKNGNIIIDSKVTNLSGVFLSVKEGAGTGEIQGNANTDGILRIEGSLYGNAQKLFNSRTYARGTNSYDIVTAGTVLNYSNRALRNPPPMLSNYLNHYKVQRVVR